MGTIATPGITNAICVTTKGQEVRLLSWRLNATEASSSASTTSSRGSNDDRPQNPKGRLDMEKITFQPNVPVRMTLKYADGKTVEGRFGDQEYYTLTDGRCMYVDMDVAGKINILGLRPGEPFEMCKYWSGKKGERPQWDVRRVDGIPPNRVTAAVEATGLPETDLERDLRRSLEARGVPTNGKPGAGVPPPAPTPAAPALVTQPAGSAGSTTHTNGSTNTNGTGYVNGGIKPAVPVKIPLNIAFREILGFCTGELKAAGEQWSDAARQDLVSTLLIQAAREGWCTLWERGNGHA
jgi:hypothetical protein